MDTPYKFFSDALIEAPDLFFVCLFKAGFGALEPFPAGVHADIKVCRDPFDRVLTDPVAKQNIQVFFVDHTSVKDGWTQTVHLLVSALLRQHTQELLSVHDLCLMIPYEIFERTS